MADNIKKVIEDDGTIHYYLGDLHYNPDGPAVIGFAGRHKEYWFKGLRHRIEGPAIEYLDGDYEYWQKGRLILSFGEAGLLPGDYTATLYVFDINSIEGLFWGCFGLAVSS